MARPHFVTGANCGGETVLGVVGDVNGFIIAVETHERRHGTKNLFSCDCHFSRDVAKNDGRDEESLLVLGVVGQRPLI